MPEQKHEPTARKPYKAPALLKWGTIADITLAVGSTGATDGGKKTSQSRTR